MLGSNPALCKKNFFPLKFSKFLPVLFIGTGAGAVDTANFITPSMELLMLSCLHILRAYLLNGGLIRAFFLLRLPFLIKAR